jgi:hypothetical protein
MPAGGATMLSAARDSVMLWATVKAVTTSGRRLVDPPSSSSPTKQQMLRAYQDMVKPGRREFPQTATRPCRVPPKYSN